MEKSIIHILTNENLNELLGQKGYVILPFLSMNEVTDLLDKFEELHPSSPPGFYATTHVPDTDFRKRASALIKQTLNSPIERNLKNINPLGGAFLSKAPGEKGILHLHQDWNIVNEERFESYNIWIPLTDVNEQNGAVRVLEGSHNKMLTFRGPNLKSVLSNAAIEAEKHMVSLNMKAGQALIYNHALWHSSPVNHSERNRLAVVYGIIPSATKMNYYYRNGDVIEEYDSNLDFFFDNNPQDGPHGLVLNRTIPYNFHELSVKEFKEIFLPAEIKAPKSWIKRLVGYFASTRNQAPRTQIKSS